MSIIIVLIGCACTSAFLFYRMWKLNSFTRDIKRREKEIKSLTKEDYEEYTRQMNKAHYYLIERMRLRNDYELRKSDIDDLVNASWMACRGKR